MHHIFVNQTGQFPWKFMMPEFNGYDGTVNWTFGDLTYVWKWDGQDMVGILSRVHEISSRSLRRATI